MSLREFIRATAKEFQDANRARTAKGATADQEGATAGNAAAESSKAASVREEEEVPAEKRKTKKSSRESHEEDGAQKRRRKERARKTLHEEEGRETAALVIEASEKQGEEERQAAETEQPATPSAGLAETTVSPPVEIENVEESPARTEPSASQTTYRPEWENIFEETMLNSPILRAEWVARALPPAELRPFMRAQTFDICDIANRAAILVCRRPVYINIFMFL